jgi:hypothetical protein
MNELEIKSSWLKIQINSIYSLPFVREDSDRLRRRHDKLVREYREIKNKIKLITNRKSKIKEVWKIDGIV